MPLIRFPTPKGLVFTIDLSKLADRELPSGSAQTLEEYRRTVEAPIFGGIQEPVFIDWGDGTPPETVSSGTWHTHTYAEGTGNIFSVTLRSATGHLPDLVLSKSDAYNATNINANLTLAITSVDHFAGTEGAASGNPSCSQYKARFTSNLTYCDPRFVSQTKWTTFSMSFRLSGIEQPVGSFCFDFATSILGAEALFSACSKLYSVIPKGFLDGLSHTRTVGSLFYNCYEIEGGIPSDLLDKHTDVNNVSRMFYGCIKLNPPPYIFWKADGSIDTDKFPNLTAQSATYAYTGCSGAMRDQVPTAYGGSRTV